MVLDSAPGIGPGSRCSVKASTGMLLELTSDPPVSGRKFGASATIAQRPARTPIIAKRPLSSVVEVICALTASLVARTVAPLIGLPSGSLMVPVILPAVCADEAAASASARVAKMNIRRIGGSYCRTSHGLGCREARDWLSSFFWRALRARLEAGALHQLVAVHLGVGKADCAGQRLGAV